MDDIFEVIIVGGSTAGLSAALTLGRALRRVLVIDSGQPCNRQTPQSHGFFTRDGATPAELLAVGREQLQTYPTVTCWPGQATQADAHAGGYQVRLADGRQATARKLLLATGVADRLPDLPGFADCWGISVLHCPYCHGYEVHGQPLGVLGNGATGFEQARLISAWTPNLRLFTNGPAALSAEQARLLAARHIAVVETPLTALEHHAGTLHHVRLTDDTAVPLTALFAHVPFAQPTDLAQQLGCALTETGLVQATEFGQTNVPGVFVAGDNSSPIRQLSIAAANGVKAAAWLNRELIEENFGA